MNKYLENFYNLYSLDDQVCYKAILEKKDWIFRRLFIPVSFTKIVEDGKDLYPELYALMDSSFLFKEMYYNRELFEGVDYQKVLGIINKFNEQFRYLHLYENLNFEDKDTFFVEINPFKIDDKVYKDLVSNFYPCFDSINELELKYDEEDMLDLLKLAMFNKEGFVLILSNEALLNNRYYLPVIEKIHYKSNIGKDKIEAIKEIASSIEVECEEYE